MNIIVNHEVKPTPAALPATLVTTAYGRQAITLLVRKIKDQAEIHDKNKTIDTSILHQATVQLCHQLHRPGANVEAVSVQTQNTLLNVLIASGQDIHVDQPSHECDCPSCACVLEKAIEALGLIAMSGGSSRDEIFKNELLIPSLLDRSSDNRSTVRLRLNQLLCYLTENAEISPERSLVRTFLQDSLNKGFVELIIKKLNTEFDEEILRNLLQSLHHYLSLLPNTAIPIALKSNVLKTLCELLRRSEISTIKDSSSHTCYSVRTLAARALMLVALTREGQEAIVTQEGGISIHRLVGLLEKKGVTRTARGSAVGAIASICTEVSTEGKKQVLDAGALEPLYSIVKEYAEWQTKKNTNTIEEKEFEGTTVYAMQALGALAEHPEARTRFRELGAVELITTILQRAKNTNATNSLIRSANLAIKQISWNP